MPATSVYCGSTQKVSRTYEPGGANWDFAMIRPSSPCLNWKVSLGAVTQPSSPLFCRPTCTLSYVVEMKAVVRQLVSRDAGAIVK